MKINIKKLLIYFIVPGLIYFIWRWSYFGEFLPLPFYVKSDFDRYLLLFNLSSLKQNLVIIGVAFLPIIIFIIRSFFYYKTNKKIIGLLVAIVFVPFIFYSSMALSQNVSYRFQYSIVLGLLILSAYVLHHISNKKILLFVFMGQILFLFPISSMGYMSLLAIPSQQIIYVAKELNTITTDASMAITEAGRLPYYSKWNAVDTWGLNTPKYTKNLIQPNDIRTASFDLIVVHAGDEDYSSLLHLNDIPVFKKKKWGNMTTNIFKGIDMDNYTLFMVPFTHINKDSLLSVLYNYMKSDQYKSNYIRYDAYFIKNNFQYSQDVKSLLLRYHAITFEEFMKLNNK